METKEEEEGEGEKKRKDSIREFISNFNSKLSELDKTFESIKDLKDDGGIGVESFEDRIRIVFDELSSLNSELSNSSKDFLPTFEQRKFSRSLSDVQAKFNDLNRSRKQKRSNRTKPFFSNLTRPSTITTEKKVRSDDFKISNVTDDKSSSKHTYSKDLNHQETSTSTSKSSSILVSNENSIKNLKGVFEVITPDQFSNDSSKNSSSSVTISDCSNSIIDLSRCESFLKHLKLYRTNRCILILSLSTHLNKKNLIETNRVKEEEQEEEDSLDNFFCSDCSKVMIILRPSNQIRIHNSKDLMISLNFKKRRKFKELLRSNPEKKRSKEEIENKILDSPMVVIENSSCLKFLINKEEDGSEEKEEEKEEEEEEIERRLKDGLIYDFNDFRNLKKFKDRSNEEEEEGLEKDDRKKISNNFEFIDREDELIVRYREVLEPLFKSLIKFKSSSDLQKILGKIKNNLDLRSPSDDDHHHLKKFSIGSILSEIFVS